MTSQLIPIADILIPDIRSNAVYSPEKWQDFLESVRTSGIQYRPSCRALPDGKIELVDGLHRIRAWKELGHTDIEIDVETLSDEQAAVKHLVANHQRGESDPVGLSKVICRLKDQGKTAAEIGKLIGYSETTVRQYATIAGLPEQFQQALTQGKLKVAHLKEISKLEDETDMAAGLTYAIQLGWTATVLKFWVENRKAEMNLRGTGGTPQQPEILTPPPPTAELAQYRQCLCCGAHGLAQEMYYWTIGKECHDSLEYLKQIDKNPWNAIQKISADQDSILAENQKLEAQVKELSQKFIDLSLRLAPMMSAQSQPAQTGAAGSISALPKPNTWSSGAPQTP